MSLASGDDADFDDMELVLNEHFKYEIEIRYQFDKNVHVLAADLTLPPDHREIFNQENRNIIIAIPHLILPMFEKTFHDLQSCKFHIIDIFERRLLLSNNC